MLNAIAFRQHPVKIITVLNPKTVSVMDQSGLCFTTDIESLRMTPPDDAEPCEALQNWLQSMADTDALAELDGPVGGLLAAQEYENQCARIYFHEHYGDEQ